MSTIANDIRTPFKSGNVLVQLIIVNVAVFAVLNIIRVVFYFSYDNEFVLAEKFYGVVSQVAMPMRFEWFIYKPWTLFTNFFAQVEIGHIFWNMVVLYFFGSIIRSYIGNGRILAIYFFGGLAGAIITLILYSTVPALSKDASIMLGASGSVMAMVTAAATLAPNQKIFLFLFGEVKLLYIALFYVVVDLIGISYVDGVGHICHLGGALTGYLFMKSLQGGRDWAKPFNSIFYGVRNVFKPRPKMKVVKRPTASATANKVKVNPAPSKDQIQKRIDFILDKISKGGYESLSKEEKDYLFTHGKNV